MSGAGGVCGRDDGVCKCVCAGRVRAPRAAEVWDTRTYCCNEDGCNAAIQHGPDGSIAGTAAVICLAIGVTMFGGAHLRLQKQQLPLVPERF